MIGAAQCISCTAILGATESWVDRFVPIPEVANCWLVAAGLMGLCRLGPGCSLTRI